MIIEIIPLLMTSIIIIFINHQDMRSKFHLQTISEIFELFGLSAHLQHPLVGVVDFSKVDQQIDNDLQISADYYSIMFKNYPNHKFRYGRTVIDFQNGSLICMAPNQVIQLDKEEQVSENVQGWGLFFHPDLIRATSLNDKIKGYNFFSYETSEALHLSEKEKQILYECVVKVSAELNENIDVHSENIIVSTIELLLPFLWSSIYYQKELQQVRSRASRKHPHQALQCESHNRKEPAYSKIPVRSGESITRLFERFT
jgi:hypothetical protein